MILRSLQVFIITASFLSILPAAADPWKDESAHDHKYEWYRYKHRHHNNREYEADDDDYGRGYHEHGGPPPWAPAHGYRRKHHRDHGQTVVIVNPPTREQDDYRERERYDDRASATDFRVTSEKIGITSGRCNRAVVGTVVGGVVGGIIGNKVAHDRDKNLGTVAGVLIGAIVGNKIGRNMDNADANCTNQALERAPDGQVVRWKNPDTGYLYAVTPYKTYKRADGRYCRDYKAEVIGNKTNRYKETACRNEKGVWQKL